MTDKFLFFLIIVIIVSIVDGFFVLPIRKIDINLYNKVRKIAAIFSVPLIVYAIYILVS